MIEPSQDFAGEVAAANRYNVELEDDAPKPKGRYKQDWESGRTVDRSDPEHITGGFSWTTERK